VRYSVMQRCYPFFVPPGREEGTYPQRPGTHEQRRRDEKGVQPGGRERPELSGRVVRSLQVAVDMLVAHALPSSARRSRAVWLSISTRS
jgi:hypothetical protein